jgi:hypothetical protein
VSGGESEEIVTVDSVLAPGEPESRQVTVFNPPQNGHFADAAVSGDDAGGEVFWVRFSCVYSQVVASLNRLLTLFTW